MKKIKHYALGLLSAALVTAGIIACSSEEANTANSETATTSWNKSADDFKGGPIAQIVSGTATLIHSETDIKSSLIAKGVFTQIESIELAYGYNPETKLQEAFVTVIGTETTSSQSLAIIADLTINGNQLIISNPEDNRQAFASHSCNGYNCRSCAYTRSGFFRRITGCTECKTIIEDGKPAGCVHSINGGGQGVETVIKVVSHTLVSP